VWKVDRVQKESCTFEMLAPQTMRRKNCGKRGASKSRNVPMSFMMSAPSLHLLALQSKSVLAEKIPTG